MSETKKSVKVMVKSCMRISEWFLRPDEVYGRKIRAIRYCKFVECIGSAVCFNF